MHKGANIEYQTNGKDKFTGKKTVVTKSAPLFVEFSKKAEVNFGIADETLAIVISYVENSPQPMEGDLSSELWLSLSDNTVLKLKPLQVYKGRVRSPYLGGVSESVFQPQYGITKEQIQMLSKTAMTAFRMAHLQGAIQKDVNEKNQKKVMTAAKCMLDALD